MQRYHTAKEKASAVCANYSDWNLCYIVYCQNTSFKINSRRYDISNLSACDDFYYMLYVEWSLPVNTGYEQFFNGSTLNAQIRRNDASILASSHNSSLLSEQMVRQAMQTGCCTEKNVRVKAGVIKGGFVVWQEDISLLNHIARVTSKKRERA